MFSAQAETYIHAARPSTWKVLTAVLDWTKWHPNIADSRWEGKAAWIEGAAIMIRSTVLGFIPVSIHGKIQMAVPQMSAVIEWRGPGIHFIDSFQFTDVLGGCRVRMRRTVHGPAAFLLRPLPWLMQVRLRQWTESLRDAVEQNPSRTTIS